jgi:hypothetical protein
LKQLALIFSAPTRLFLSCFNREQSLKFDVQFGFITSIQKDRALCRYWKKDVGFLYAETSEEAFEMLQTKSNGEWTPVSELVDMAEDIDPMSIGLAQKVIDDLIEWMKEKRFLC